MKKKNTKREKTPYSGIKKNYNLKSRQDELDYDYIDKLNDEEKDWLNRFTEEYVNANFKHEGKKLFKGKKKRKICNDKNNARNRCQYTRSKAQGGLYSVETNILNNLVEKRNPKSNGAEELMIAVLDKTKKLKKTSND